MTATPAVTVLLPVYNGERHLAEALDSVLGQTFTDFEFVIVDDGSTDSSPEILAAYALRDSRVRVHRQPVNSGITATLNAGCRLARGRFVAITNQDDVCLPRRLHAQLAYLDTHPGIGLVGAWADLIDDEGRFLLVKQYPTDPAVATWSMHFMSSVLHPVVTVRREVLERIGFYPIGYGGGSEDFALGMKISQVSQVCNLPEVLVRYRFHTGNFSNKRRDEQEAEGDRIVAEGVQHVLGRSITHELGFRMRGLSTDQFTKDPRILRELGDVIVNLHRAFVRRPDFAAQDLAGVHRDAAVRLWLLAYLAASSSPGLAAALGTRALSISPTSVFTFATKAGRGVRRRLRARMQSR